MGDPPPVNTQNGSWRFVLILSFVLLLGWNNVFGIDSPVNGNEGQILCPTAQECFVQAVRVLDHEQPIPSSQWEQAVARLNAVRSRFPDSVWAQRATVQLGLLFRHVAPERAIPLFQDARETFPVLEDYFHFWLGEAYLQLSDTQRAAEAFQAVVGHAPHTVLKAEARFRAGEAWIQTGSCARGLPLLQQAVEEDSKADWVPRALLAIGKCGLRLNQLSLARDALRAVWSRYPLAPEADRAASLLGDTKQMAPTPAEQFQRALALQQVGRFEAAVSAWQSYLASEHNQGKNWAKARFHLGLAYTRLRQYAEAEKIFQALAASRSTMAGQATVWLGRVYLRQDSGAKLVDLCRSKDQAHLSGNQRALLWVFCGVWFQDQGRTQDALDAFQQAVTVAATRNRRLDALWRIGWLHYQHGHYDHAVSTFQTMVRQAQGSGEFERRARYWLGRAQEQIDELEAARHLYRALGRTFPYTYYGRLALARLHPEDVDLISAGTRTVVSWPHDTRSSSSLTKDRHYQKAVNLARFHLFSYAVRELEGLIERYAAKQEELMALLELAHQVRAYHVGIRLAVKRFGLNLQQGRVPPSSPIWSAAYPKGYVSTIDSDGRNGIDPYLVLSIIREESLYDRRAISRVGAMGLMQLMPDTAQKVARTLGMTSLSQTSLFDPTVNVRLGSAYLAQLLEQFGGNVVHAVAAYNAGPHVVRRWLVRHKGQRADEFVESIPYRETRRYVKRVLGSYRIYQALNGGRCWAISLDRVC